MRTLFYPFSLDVKYAQILPSIASLIYFLPAAIMFFLLIDQVISYNNLDLLFINFWEALSFALFNLLISIGLYRKNIIAWWTAIILPILILGYGIFLFVYFYYQSSNGNNSKSLVFTLIISTLIMQVGVYYLLGLILIIIPEVKVLFKKDNKV